VRTPSCILSTAAADNSVSAEAMNAIASAAVRIDGFIHCAQNPAAGGAIAAVIEAGTCTRATSRPSATASNVPVSTPTSAPGNSLSEAGRNFSHASIAAMVARPMPNAISVACRLNGDRPNRRAGAADRFCSPLGKGFASNRTWNCPATISTPIPASMPCTTAGEIARNQPPRRKIPAANWIAPASSRIGPSALKP
jgi:hypothetical protein